MRLFPALLLLLASPALAGWSYKETSRMEDPLAKSRALAAQGKSVLLAFDIDNTLLLTEQTLGSEQWFEDAIHGVKDDAAFREILALNNALTSLTSTKLVEPGLAKRIDELPAQVRVVAVTSRGPELAEPTLKAFKANGLDFKDLCETRRAEIKIGGRAGLYRDGVFLTAGADKGKAIEALAAKLGLKPDAVVFVDNDPVRKHHAAVRAALAGRLDAHGYRYSKYDGLLSSYGGSAKRLAEVQLQEYRKSGALISDAEARRRLYGLRSQ